MAAIAGCFSSDGFAPSRQQINGSLGAMAPRGGAQCEFLSSNTLTIGLSFNDTYAQGKLVRADDPKICIAVDGLLFNLPDLIDEFDIRPQAGIDPLIQLYIASGVEFIPQLNGTFAMAIWDGARAKLVLSKDSIGSKPLHYRVSNANILFASHLQGIRQLENFPVEPDHQAVDDYLTYAYVPPPRTLVAGVQQVRHGQYIVFEKGRVADECVFATPSSRILTDDDEQAWALELERLLLASVTRRINASTRVGCLLSGGVDTATIVGAASMRSKERIRTFTLRFDDSPEIDESTNARATSRIFGTDHTEVDVNASCIVDLPRIAAFASSPPANASSLISFSLFKQIKPAVDTVLCGDGGNDLLGGHYRYNQVVAYAQDYRRTPIRRFLLKHGRRTFHLVKDSMLEPALEVLARSFFARSARSLSVNHIAAMDRSHFDGIVAYYIDADSFWRQEDKRLLYSADFHRQINAAPPTRFVKTLFDYEREVSVFQQLPYVRLNSFVPYSAMLYMEPTAAANRVQPLFPILDQDLISFIYTVPFQSIFGKSFRHLMKVAFADRMLPARIFRRRVRGFRIPAEKWMRTKAWREVVNDNLSSQAIERRGWFAAPYVQTLLNRFYAGNSYRRDRTLGNVTSVGLLIWSLLALEVWMRENVD